MVSVSVSVLRERLFGDPVLVVLDEPNANLDADGDEALTAAIKGLRERGRAVVVMAHRPSAIAAVDKLADAEEAVGRSPSVRRKRFFAKVTQLAPTGLDASKDQRLAS